MRKIALAVLLLASSSAAYAQIVPPPVGPNIAVTGTITAQGLVSSTNNTTPAGPTNSGVALSAAPDVADTLFFDASQAANNRTYEILGFQGGLNFRFKNDAGNAATTWLKASGGQAAGISGITSNSGSGAWAHTGPMTVSGTFQASGGVKLQSFLTAAIPACSAGNTGLTITVQDVGGTPAWNAILPAGTGSPVSSTTFPVFCDGTNWRIH